MNVIQFFLGRRRGREDDPDVNAQPTKKKIKTEHNNNNGGGNEDAFAARKTVFSDYDLVGNVAEFLHNREELQLAVCGSELYRIFVRRAVEKFVSIYKETDPDQQRDFVVRTLQLAMDALPEGARVVDDKPNYWESMWMWLRGQRPPRWLVPYRYRLLCAYRVPVDLQKGFRFGPSCSYGDRLFCLGENGHVVTFDAEPKPVATHATRQAELTILSPGYSAFSDKLWYSATNSGSSSNIKGFLVLEHSPFLQGGSEIRVIDLAQTNQDIGRTDSLQGIDHRLIRPTETFYKDDGYITGEVVVSQDHGLIFFVRGFDGKIWIESYDMTGHLVASTQKTVEAQVAERHVHLITKSVVTGDKLVIFHFTESAANENRASVRELYLFGWHDLSFCGYTPLSRVIGSSEIHVTRISKDWLFYYQPPGVEGPFALRITGGNVGLLTTMNDGNIHDDILIVGNYLYAYRYPHDDQEGDIEFDQFDLWTGNKIRTLRTGIPWNFNDDGSAYLPLAGPPVEGQVHRLSRIIDGAHVVGNRVAFLISSVGRAKNTIVTFALPPSP